jgi:hypothetical protein
MKPYREERFEEMETIAVQIELAPQQFDQVRQLAHSRRMAISGILELAIEEWLTSQTKLERTRLVMRDLGQGLGEGEPNNNTAQEHDVYLYGPEPS